MDNEYEITRTLKTTRMLRKNDICLRVKYVTETFLTTTSETIFGSIIVWF